MTISLFDPRSLGKMLVERKAPKGLFKVLFFRNEQPYDTEHIDFDVVTKVRLMAPFSSMKLPGKVVDDQGFVTKSFTPPLVNPKKVTSAESLMSRVAGEAVYGGLSPDERASVKLGQDLAELDDMIRRREEWMCASAVLNGTVVVTGQGVNTTLSFGRNAGNTIALPAAASRWSASTSDPLNDLRTWSRTIVQRTGIAPDNAVLGSEAAAALLAHAGVQAQLDNRRMDLGQIAPEYREAYGATYLGTIKGTQLDLWSYDEWYIDPEDIATGEQSMMPTKQVVLGSSRAQTEIAYGAVPVATGTDGASAITLVTGTRVPESWIEKEPAARFLKVSSRPLPIPVQVNAFLRATVIA